MHKTDTRVRFGNGRGSVLGTRKGMVLYSAVSSPLDRSKRPISVISHIAKIIER